ncbi:hypothetical protein E2C01_020454 [Portunus trituberculatus]|uniref:Uncharacterized protein n=1 Tax=Portunus trituberculatus TaxID=210409 RepID=A0A5B7E2B8_PORTR|nr:hypothetical protein [Portunus trituberculatus]
MTDTVQGLPPAPSFFPLAPSRNLSRPHPSTGECRGTDCCTLHSLMSIKSSLRALLYETLKSGGVMRHTQEAASSHDPCSAQRSMPMESAKGERGRGEAWRHVSQGRPPPPDRVLRVGVVVMVEVVVAVVVA